MKGRMIPVNEENHHRELYDSKKDTFCTSPVAKAPVVFPESLIGRAKVNFDMYSGYVNVSSAPDYLFYWYFSSQDKNPDAPLIIWTNGTVIWTCRFCF
jgi:hypothetical protein